jgi:hypothetical protein
MLWVRGKTKRDERPVKLFDEVTHIWSICTDEVSVILLINFAWAGTKLT